jgi:8-oxo-dGTP pyrophosphatase MutT (NUDIX family)
MTETAAPAPDEKPPTKAGVFLYGWVKHGKGPARLHIVAPYTEGRFGNHDKYYSLAKGFINQGESPIEAARRETVEETGIDIRSLLGADAYERLSAGESVSDLPVAGYPKVRVRHANATPIEHTYISGHGAHHEVAYYAIEVEGIDHLRGHLKHLCAADFSTRATVHKTALEHLQSQGLPNFDTRMAILRSGIVPAKRGVVWAARSPQRIIEQPALPALEAEFNNKKAIQTPEEWFAFCASIPGKQHKRLQADMETLKRHFEKSGAISDAGNKLKLDTKDRPLFFYQEGAEILPLQQVLERSEEMAKRTPLYARAMWGEYVGKRRPEADAQERMKSAQIAPLIDLYAQRAPNEVAAVLHNGATALPTPSVPAYIKIASAPPPSPWVGRVSHRAAPKKPTEIPNYLLPKPAEKGNQR